jgi:Cupin superfamily protein
MTSLKELLTPAGVDAFTDHYPDRWLHLPQVAPTDVYDWAALNQTLQAATLPCDWINIVRAAARTTPADLTDLAAQVRDGHTLVVRHLEHVHAGVQALAQDLSDELGEPVAANLYVSQPGTQGFRVHYDSHDVLVIQLAGVKTWQIHERMIPYLVSGMPGNDTAVPDETQPLARPTLQPGDVLYLPRGQWHAALADTESMHLTLGIHPRTGVDLLTFLADHLRRLETLRRPGPIEPLRPGEVLGPRRRAHFAETLALLREALGDPALLDAYARHIADRTASRPRVVFPASQALDEPGQRWQAVPGLQTHIATTGRDLEVTAFGATVTLPTDHAPLVEALGRRVPFTAAVLPDGSATDRSELLRILFSLGWIEPASPGQPGETGNRVVH